MSRCSNWKDRSHSSCSCCATPSRVQPCYIVMWRRSPATPLSLARQPLRVSVLRSCPPTFALEKGKERTVERTRKRRREHTYKSKDNETPTDAARVARRFARSRNNSEESQALRGHGNHVCPLPVEGPQADSFAGMSLKGVPTSYHPNVKATARSALRIGRNQISKRHMSCSIPHHVERKSTNEEEKRDPPTGPANAATVAQLGVTIPLPEGRSMTRTTRYTRFVRLSCTLCFKARSLPNGKFRLSRWSSQSITSGAILS